MIRLLLAANALAVGLFAVAIISVRRWIESEQADHRRSLL